MTSSQRWRQVQPIDALRGAYCRLAVAQYDPLPARYKLCGYRKYPNETTTTYYVAREDGTTAFFKEDVLQVEEVNR